MSEYLFKTEREIMTCQECPIVKKYRLGTICPLREGAERKFGTCPLGEVQAHGDLKDWEKIKEIFSKYLPNVDDDTNELLCTIMVDIGMNAPNVIEASTSNTEFCNTEGCSNSKPDMSKAQNHICPYYQGVCSLDEHIICYRQHHYEMCDKYIEVSKERE